MSVAPDTLAPRSVAEILPAVETLEGTGFVVRRPFPRPGVEQLDPFLLLDEMGPRHLAPGEARGAPDHPHRGFETVTYVLDGELEHEDSAGHAGLLGPGDVQWMTAGAGVVHSEMPSRRFQRDGGRLHGVQLWVNLPAAAKMVPPRYQEIGAADVPVVSGEGVDVRVIAGSHDGVRGAVETHIPISYLHVRVDADRSVVVDAPRSRTALVYLLDGTMGMADGTAGRRGDLLRLAPDGDAVTGRAGGEGADLLVLTGEPLHEPLARYGPFVMNTRAELAQAVEDYRAGRMGLITR